MNSLANDFDKAEEMKVEQAKAFIKENPLVKNKVDELGLVDLWLRIEGLHNLISVWDSNHAAFSRQGPDELRLWHIRKRIWSHKLYAKYNGNDEQVKALVAIIRLHAQMASRYINEEFKFSAYDDVATYAELSGHYLAEKIENKYGKAYK
jgi:hypothetical protein